MAPERGIHMTENQCPEETGADRIGNTQEPSVTESEVRETKTGYRTSYSTEDGGAGYSFTPYESGVSPDGTKDRNRAGRGKSHRVTKTVWSILLAVSCIGLCFFGGYAGTVFAGRTLDTGSEKQSTAGSVPYLDSQSPSGNGNGSAAGGYTTAAEVISAVSDSVVLLSTETYTENLLGEPILTATGEASGVIFSEDGYILTNAHVVEGVTAIRAELSDGTTYDARVVGYDSPSDLAVIRIYAADKQLQAAEFGCSSDLVAGEEVVMIGNPYGLGKLSSDGMVSAVDITCEVEMSDGETMTLIPVIASIDPGDSGGGMFNMDGKLVGIVNATRTDSGIGFAIPIDSAVGIINELCRYGYVRGVIDHGLSLLDVTMDNLAHYHYRYGIGEIGVYVVSSKYSDALQNKDRIVAVNGTEIQTTAEFEELVSGYAVGDVLTLTVCREYETFETELVLHELIPAGIEVLET